MADTVTEVQSSFRCRMIRRGLRFIYLLGVLTIFAIIFVPSDFIRKSGGRTSIIIMDTWVYPMYRWFQIYCILLFATGVALLILRYAFRRPWLPQARYIWGTFLLGCLFPILGYGVILGYVLSGAWHVDYSLPFVMDANHKHYWLLLRPYLLGKEAVLARDGDTIWYGRQYDVLASSSSGIQGLLSSPTSGFLSVPVVRPARWSAGSDLSIVVADTGWVVVVTGNSCRLAYDQKTKVGFGSRSERFSGKGIDELSPFILIGPNTEMNEDDVRKLTEWKGPEKTSNSYPRKEILARDLNHANENVRKIAQELLRRRAGN